MELKISNIQNFAVHDGPGIRTVIFLSGCPLRCTWCHNPETQSDKAILLFDEKKCIGCRLCGECRMGVHRFDGRHTVNRDDCIGCSECINICPTRALGFSTRRLSAEEFYGLVEKQRRLMGDDGGITFSGGEPLMQAEAILSLLDGCEIHTAIETCGYADEYNFCRVIERMDFVMLDLKLADGEQHKKYTGVSNTLILKKLENLRKSGKPYVLRTPMIPGITDTGENLTALAGIIGDDPWEKLAYNPLTPSKYERLGKKFVL